MEEELRAAKTTSRAGSTDNSYQLLGQVRSDLYAAQSLVSSLTAENSQLVWENVRLGHENLMVQKGQTRVAENQEERALNANVRWEPHTRSMAVVEGPGTETEDTQWSSGRGSGASGGSLEPMLGTWLPNPTSRREIEGMVLGEGGGGLGVRGDGSHCGRSGIESAPLPVPTVVDVSSVGSVRAPRLEARDSCGSNTKTTFSTERPRTVTFAGVVPQPTSSDPSLSTVVSVGNYGIVGGGSEFRRGDPTV